jgi:hypothetical protein
MPREEGLNISAVVPPPIDNAGAAKNPAKKRQITIVAMFCATALPMVKNADTGRVTRYIIERPNVSLRGAARTGPKERPRLYNESPNRDTVVETPKCSATSSVPEL